MTNKVPIDTSDESDYHVTEAFDTWLIQHNEGHSSISEDYSYVEMWEAFKAGASWAENLKAK